MWRLKSARPGLQLNLILTVVHYLCKKNKNKKHFIISFQTTKYLVETEDEKSKSTFSLHLQTLAGVYKCCFGDFSLINYCNFSGSHSILPPMALHPIVPYRGSGHPFSQYLSPKLFLEVPFIQSFILLANIDLSNF